MAKDLNLLIKGGLARADFATSDVPESTASSASSPSDADIDNEIPF
jgi:hypothetical protein